MTNLDSILKSRDTSVATNVHIVKAMVFPVVMYRCDSWTIKSAEHWRIDAFELWCWRRLLTVPWTARRSNQSILKEISPVCSLEGLMLKLNFTALEAINSKLSLLSWNQDISRAAFPSETERICLLPFSASGSCQHSFTYLPPSSHYLLFFPFVCMWNLLQLFFN